MNAGKQPPTFVFDFTRADQVAWSEDRSRRELGGQGIELDFLWMTERLPMRLPACCRP